MGLLLMFSIPLRQLMELQAQGPAHLADLNCISEQLLEIDLVLVPWEILLQAPRGKEFHDEFNPTSS